MVTRAALLFVVICGCAAPDVAIDDIDRAPAVQTADQQYADAFKLLDGTWNGEFKIFVDTRGQVDGPSQPTEFNPDDWKAAPYQLASSIAVTQVYTSESPYFQRVEITDTYGDGKVVKSRGVNKVQDGKLLCVVKKPDDLVIHDGALEGDDTIIWSRDRAEPKAVEYFRETVAADTYRIVGWGYYGADDVSKAPRMYFDATYTRQ